MNYLKWELIWSLKLVFPYGPWMHLTLNVHPWLSFSVIFGNQLEASVQLLLICQPIVMKLWGAIERSILPSCLWLFSRIPLHKQTQRLRSFESGCRRIRRFDHFKGYVRSSQLNMAGSIYHGTVSWSTNTTPIKHTTEPTEHKLQGFKHPTPPSKPLGDCLDL